MGSAMASANDEGPKFSDRNFGAPHADGAAGGSGVSATSAVSPAATMKIIYVDSLSVRPNPWRRFDLDPLDPERIEMLAQSFDMNGVLDPWYGRKTKTGYELCAKHHRFEAAKKIGMTRIPMIVENYSDFDMWRIGAVENGTQRSTHTAAATDACAGGIRLVARLALLGKDEELGKLLGVKGSAIVEPSHNGHAAPAQIRAYIENGKGIGTPTILKLCETQGVGFPRRVIDEAMASLKADGRIGHDAIVKAVANEVAAELRKQKEDAEAAAAQAAERAARAEAARLEAEERARKAAEEERQRKAELQRARAEADARRQREAEAAAKKAAERRAQQEAAERHAKKEAEARKAEAIAKDKIAHTAEEREERIDTILEKEISHRYDSRCASLFANDYQNEIFRKYVTQEKIARALPVDKQYDLARQYVDWISDNQKRTAAGKMEKAKPKSGQIDTTRMSEGSLHKFMGMVMDQIASVSKGLNAKLAAAEAQKATLEKRLQVARDDVLRGLATASGGLARYNELIGKWPADEQIPEQLGAEFISRLREFSHMVNQLLKAVKS